MMARICNPKKPAHHFLPATPMQAPSKATGRPTNSSSTAMEDTPSDGVNGASKPKTYTHSANALVNAKRNMRKKELFMGGI